MKKTLIFILAAVICISAGIGAYMFFTYEEPVIICNGMEITDGIYTIYFLNEAILLDYSDYDSYDSYIDDIRSSVLDRICIDSYYNQMCINEKISLTGEDETAAESELLSRMIELGFDYAKYNNEAAFLEYFNVRKEDFRNFYLRKALYKKYYEYELNKYSDIPKSTREIRRNYSSLIDRIKMTSLYNAYSRELILLTANINQYFNENRLEYAKNSVDTIYMEFPKDADGNISEAVKTNYRRVGRKIKNSLEQGAIIHELKTRDNYKDYIKSAELLGVDSSSNLKYLYGEEFIELCVNGDVNEVFMHETENGIVVFRIYQIHGVDENMEELEKIIRSKEIGNKVRKAILEEEYEPEILNMEFYESFDNPSGTIWEKLLEK